jgi:hypothetical protein
MPSRRSPATSGDAGRAVPSHHPHGAGGALRHRVGSAGASTRGGPVAKKKDKKKDKKKKGKKKKK